MKFIFCVRNNATDTYGMPFVSSSVDEAIKSVVSSLKPDDAFKLLSQSSLYVIGSFDPDSGCIKRDRKRLAASALQLGMACKKGCKNLLSFLDEMESNIAFIRSTMPKEEVIVDELAES